MAQVLGGYEDDASSTNSPLRKVTVSEQGTKALLDVKAFQGGTWTIASTSTLSKVIHTGTGALNFTTNINENFKLISVKLHLDGIPITSEDYVINYISEDGVIYNTVLFKFDPSKTSSTDLVYLPKADLLFKQGDELNISFANTDGATYGLTLVYEVV